MSESAPLKSRREALIGIFALIIPFGYGVMMLSTFPLAGEGVGFNTVIVFAIILVFSLVFLIIAFLLSRDSAKWWFDGPELKDFIYFVAYPVGKIPLPFGIFALLGASFLIPLYLGSIGIFVALAVGGVVLAVQLYKTNSILVPWITHWVYNTFAIMLSSFSILPLSASPIYVPNFQFEGISTSAILDSLSRQVTLQLIAVSLAEEFMKVSIMAGAFMAFRSNRGVAIGIATTAWVLMHSILAYRV